MTGYTLNSGIKQVTISSYCPVCLTKGDFTGEKSIIKGNDLPLSRLCCNDTCAEVYKTKLLEFDIQVKRRYHVSTQYQEKDFDAYFGVVSYICAAYLTGDKEEIYRVVEEYKVKHNWYARSKG